MASAPPTAPGTRAPATGERALPKAPAAPTTRASQQRRRHRPPRPVLAVLILLLLGSAAWWGVTVQPWAEPAGPLRASGTLEADEVLVGAEVAGRIVELAAEGQTIRSGEVVAQLDDTLLQLQLRQVDAATQQQLRIQIERYRPRSPIAGVVTRVPLHSGEVVAPGQTVVVVADLTSLKLTAYVLERDLGQVWVGQEVAVSADPFPGRTFRGLVTSTNPRAEFTPRNVQTQRDRLNLVFGVKVRVENPDGALKPGMPADATFAPAS